MELLYTTMSWTKWQLERCGNQRKNQTWRNNQEHVHWRFTWSFTKLLPSSCEPSYICLNRGRFRFCLYIFFRGGDEICILFFFHVPLFRDISFYNFNLWIFLWKIHIWIIPGHIPLWPGIHRLTFLIHNFSTKSTSYLSHRSFWKINVFLNQGNPAMNKSVLLLWRGETTGSWSTVIAHDHTGSWRVEQKAPRLHYCSMIDGVFT